MGARGYPAEFRRRVKVDRRWPQGRRGGRRSRHQCPDDLHLAPQERIDRRLEAGLSTVERAELTAARKRIRELETEVAIHRRATELLKDRADPKGGSRPPR